VLLALRALKIGQSLEAGLAIVVIAIVLDRLSQAAVHTVSTRRLDMRPIWQRHPYLFASLALIVVTTLLALVVPAFAAVPETWTVTLALCQTGDRLDQPELLIPRPAQAVGQHSQPVRDLLVDLPWPAVGLIGVAGWQFAAGPSLLVMLLTGFALVGLGKTATVYLVISVVISVRSAFRSASGRRAAVPQTI
jgi:glycine betaine/proline transport system permease protein